MRTAFISTQTSELNKVLCSSACSTLASHFYSHLPRVWSTLRVPANHHLLPAPFPLLNCCSLPDIWKQNRQEHPDWLCSIPLAPDIFSLGKQRDTDCGWGKWDLLGELHSNYIYFRIIQVHLITPGVSLILLQLNPGGFRLGWNVKYQLKQKKKILRYSQNGCFPKMR